MVELQTFGRSALSAFAAKKLDRSGATLPPTFLHVVVHVPIAARH